VYVDAWALLSAPDGSYTTSVVDPADGRYKRVRSADGFHLNMAGVRILARAVNGVIAASR
jgi:lysophospholipase L1-like esterase